MRIAVQATGDAGLRAARILLGEAELTALGYLDRSPRFRDDPRERSIDRLDDFDVLVSDDVDDPVAVAERALDAAVSCVLWSDLWDDPEAIADLEDAFAGEGLVIMAGASLGTGIAAVLAQHEQARTEELLELDMAWTVPGRRRRRGEGLPFPDPVGALWGRLVEDEHPPAPARTRRFIAPVDGEWAGAMVRATGLLGDGVARRVIGISDHAGHLEGLALAAGAVTVARYPLNAGLYWPLQVADEYLHVALDAGLEVATFTAEETSPDRM